MHATVAPQRHARHHVQLMARLCLIALLAALVQVSAVAPASAGQPTGGVDYMGSNSPGNVTVRGYAYDPENPTQVLDIHVYVDNRQYVFRADGANHTFNLSFDVPAVGNVTWAVFAIGGTNPPNPVIGSGNVVIADPTVTGKVTNWESKVHRTIDVAGWASDSNAPTSPVAIEAYIGGTFSTPGVEYRPLTANVRRADGTMGFSGRLSTNKTGTQSVYVYAINVPGTPGANRLIGVVKVNIYVDSRPPETTITSAPSTATTDDLIHVQFTSDEPNSTFQCRWDQEPWFDCAGGTAVKLTAGNHRIAVRATDQYGNQDASPAVWVVTVTQGPTTPTPTPTDPGTQTGRSIVAKAVKKKSRLRINVGPDSATTNYRVIIQRKVGKKWRKVTRTRTRGPKDIVTINLKRGKYRAVLPKSSAGPALRSNTVRLKR